MNPLYRLSITVFAIAFLLIFAIGFVGGRYFPDLANPIFLYPFVLGVLLIPIGFQKRVTLKNLEEADRKIPELLRDISDYAMFGVPLSDAFLRVGKNSYGPLDAEIKAVRSKVLMGAPIEEALDGFGSALNSENVKRAGFILKKAAETGSNTSDVISMLSEFINQIEILREQRKVEMANYDLILMISFAVFLIVVAIIDLRFFSVLRPSSSSLLSFQGASTFLIETAFALAIYGEAIGIGAIIGIIRDRSVLSGFLEIGGMLMVS
ncbi:MAG TPA: type II secretion system F family protein [Thermoplasmataceae archaeon]|nr:type II secretion system F family protein [Thermoplasmataceae archaeon]